MTAKPPIVIRCACCERTQAVRSSRVEPADEYLCGRCTHDPELQPRRLGPNEVVKLMSNAAGAFTGRSVIKVTVDNIEYLRAVVRARVLAEMEPKS